MYSFRLYMRYAFVLYLPCLLLLAAWLVASLPPFLSFDDELIPKGEVILQAISFPAILLLLVEPLTSMLRPKSRELGLQARGKRKPPSILSNRFSHFLACVLVMGTIMLLFLFIGVSSFHILTAVIPLTSFLLAPLLDFIDGWLGIPPRSWSLQSWSLQSWQEYLVLQEKAWRATPESKRLPTSTWFYLGGMGLGTAGIFYVPAHSVGIICCLTVWCICFALLMQRIGKNLPSSHPWHPLGAYLATGIFFVLLLVFHWIFSYTSLRAHSTIIAILAIFISFWGPTYGRAEGEARKNSLKRTERNEKKNPRL